MLGCEKKSLLGRACYEDRFGSRQGYDLRITRPIWSRHEHLIARTEEGEGRVEERLLGTRPDHDPFPLNGGAGHRLQISRDRPSQFRQSRHRRIAGAPGPDAGHRRVRHPLRSIEVRLTGAQIDDIAAFGSESPSQ